MARTQLVNVVNLMYFLVADNPLQQKVYANRWFTGDPLLMVPVDAQELSAAALGARRPAMHSGSR